MKYARFTLLALAAIVLMSGCGKSGEPTRATPGPEDTPSLDNTPPPVPSGLTLVDDPMTGKSTMTWTASSAPDVAGYEIFLYEPDPNRDNSYVLLYDTDITSYGLDPTDQVTIKHFRVRAVDSSGNRSALCPALTAEIWPIHRAGGGNPDDPPPLPTMDP